MELVKERDEYLEEILAGNERIYISEDVIVPDTKPDVLKILQVDAYSSISDKGIINNAFYTEGKIYVNILYIPDNDEEGLNCIKTSFNFKEKFEKTDLNSDMKLKISCDVTRIEFNVLNSRKLSIKAHVNCSYKIIDNKEVSYPYGFHGECGECITKTIITDRISAVEDCDFMLRDSFEIPSGKDSAKEILKTDFKICNQEIKAVTGKLIAKGTLKVCILYSTINNSVDFCECEFPFTEVFDVYDLLEEDDCKLDLNICDLTSELSEDNDSDLRIINIEALINASLITERKKEINFITDCYMVGANTTLSYDDFDLRQYIDEIKLNTSIKEIITPLEKLPNIVKIYNIIPETEITQVIADDKKIITEGKIKVYVLYLTDNPKCPVYSFKHDIPFDFSHECHNSQKGMQAFYDIKAEHISFNLTASGEIEFRCVLSQQIKVYDTQKIKLINNIESSPLENDNRICIYFAKDDDCLWSIAKKYSVKVSDIKAINSLEDDTVLTGKKLLIPAH